MYIYKYTWDSSKITKEKIAVNEREKSYTLISNPHIRFSKNKMEIIDPETDVLLSLKDDLSYAAQKYIIKYTNLIEVYKHTIDIIERRNKTLELYCNKGKKPNSKKLL